jgi:hypothetical protein
MPEIFPAGALSQLSHFQETEGTSRGQPRIRFRHLIAIDCGRHKIHGTAQPAGPAQIGD